MTQDIEKPAKLTAKELEQKIKDLRAQRTSDKNKYKELSKRLSKLVDTFVAEERLPYGSIFNVGNLIDTFYKSGIAIGLSDYEISIAKHYWKQEWLDFPKK